MNRKSITLLALAGILGLLFWVPLRAQVSGATLSGTITDAQGKAVPGAKVTAKNLATNITAETTTNDSGAYNLPNLIPAEYEVKVSAQGFSTAVSKVTLTVGAKQEMDLALKVGQVSEQIQVTEGAAQIELASSTISGTVEAAEVRELPLNGRDWASLANLQPGVAQVRTQEQVQQVGSHARGLGMQLSIGGNRPTQNTYRLNGLIINDYSNAGPGSVLGQNLGVDAIQEFSVLTSNYSSEYGYTSGGVVNAITRSGTNQFHGSVYEFLRNSYLDAADFFDNAAGLKRAQFRRNQFGASAGGPLWKDKIFIFGDYEGLRQSKGISNTANTLSDEARMGILGDPATGAPIAPFMVNSLVAPYLTFFPKVNAGLLPPSPGLVCNQTTVICNTGKYTFSGAQVVPENYFTTRGDVKISDKDSLNANYYYDHSVYSKPDGLNQVLDGFIIGRQGVSAEETHIFTPSIANTVRFGYNRTFAFGQSTLSAINKAAADPTLALSIGGTPVPGLFAPRLNVSGLTNFTGGLHGQSVQNYTHQTYQIYDDAVLTKGTHSLKFGFMFIRYHEALFAPFIEDGTITFSSISDFLTNIPHRASAPPNLSAIRTHDLFTSIPGLYIQDDWHLFPHLTVNLGLRYEMATIPTESHGFIDNLPHAYTDPGGQNCPNCNHVFFLKNPTTKNFAPRIGLAWDPFGDGKTAVRAGFGLFDALPLPYELVINNAQTSPFHVSGSVTNPGQGTFPGGLLALVTNPPVANQTWNFVEQTPKRNYIYQYNLNVQRQFGWNTSITIAYAGSRGLHNPTQMDDINTTFPTLTSAGWLFPNPNCSAAVPAASCLTQAPTPFAPGHPVNFFVSAAGAVQTTIWESKSWYNALQVLVEKRMSHGFQVHGSFTWSKTMDTSSGSFAGDNFAGDVSPTVPWWDLKIVKGLSDFDVRRNLVINALWQVPTPNSWHGAAGWIAKGWGIGGIMTLSGGVPVWPLSPPGQGADIMGQNNSEPIAIPDVVHGCSQILPSTGRHGALQYVNPACFINAVAPSSTFFNMPAPLGCDTTTIPIPAGASPLTCFNLLGHLGRNTVIGPGLFNLDYSMIKDTKVPKISESFDVQFRAEFFNILNHPNFAPPNVNNLSPFDGSGLPVAGFGQLTNLQVPPREIQFALKIIW